MGGRGGAAGSSAGAKGSGEEEEEGAAGAEGALDHSGLSGHSAGPAKGLSAPKGAKRFWGCGGLRRGQLRKGFRGGSAPSSGVEQPLPAPAPGSGNAQGSDQELGAGWAGGSARPGGSAALQSAQVQG